MARRTGIYSLHGIALHDVTVGKLNVQSVSCVKSLKREVERFAIWRKGFVD